MKKIYLIVVFALIALCAGILISNHYFSKEQLPLVKVSTLFVPPQPIDEFHLIDTHKRPFTKESFTGHWTLMFFGFTRCQMVCPVAMSALAQTYKTMLKDKQNPMPQVVFVSIDPDNDTPAKIAKYVTAFNPHFQGVTGTQENVDQLAADLNVLYIKVKANKKGEEDSLDHSGSVLLINPEGQLAAVFSAPLDPAAIAKDFQLIAQAQG